MSAATPSKPTNSPADDPPDIDAPDEAAEPEPDEVEAEAEELDTLEDQAVVYGAQTERAKAYTEALGILLAAQGFPVGGGVADTALSASHQTNLDRKTANAVKRTTLAVLEDLRRIVSVSARGGEESR